jgi:hypothetical protein
MQSILANIVPESKKNIQPNLPYLDDKIQEFLKNVRLRTVFTEQRQR